MKGLIRVLELVSLLLILALAVPIQAAPSVQRSDCDYYVDNYASSDGDGSWLNPWDNINNHVNELRPGNTMCIRGDLSAPGRVYTEPTISLDKDTGTPSGTEEAPIIVRTYPGEHVVLRTTGARILDFVEVAHWQFDGFGFDKESDWGCAIYLSQANFNIIRNCEIYNGKEKGIGILGGEHNIIENCKIHDFDAGPYSDTQGILIAAGKDTVIRDNEIYDCTGDGVLLYNYGDVSGTIIENNHFYTTLGPCSENAIDVKVGSPVIRGNVMHGYRPCDGSCGGSGGTVGEAIVIHLDAKEVVIEGNTIYDSGSGIRAINGESFRIINNVIHDIITDPDVWSNFGIYANKGVTVEILNNTLVDIPRVALLIEGGQILDLHIYNNLFYNTGQIVYRNAGTGTMADYNGWFSATERIEGPHDIVGSGDPGFVDATNDDYHLTADSPARDAGTDVGVTTDFEGDPRPFGDLPDIGADEYAPILYLTATPHDRAIYLSWTEFKDPALASYAITYTYDTGGNDASQGPSPILGIPPSTQVYSLTEVTNYVFYTVTVAARDESNVNLAVSNNVRVMPTDIFVYLPLIVKEVP